jgi:predicted TIM-barrel enzyme/aminoglycoside phosphotransferase (APT) family kinase protein
VNATPRERALSRLRRSLARGSALLATGAGSGLAAAAAERGGADLVVIYNSGRFRSAGHGSLSGLLPFANANAVVEQMAREVLSVVSDVPVIAGVCATDPFRDLDAFVHELREMGVSGVQNFPTIGLYGAAFRADLEATGISFEREVELVRVARRAGLLTCAFVTDPADARRVALAGVDLLVPHLGVTRAGGAPEALTTAVAEIDGIAAAAHEVRDDLLLLFHGGPAVLPGEVQRVFAEAEGLHGFFAASSVERFPVEEAVAGAVSAFGALHAKGADGAAPRAGPDFSQPAPELPVELTVDTLETYLRERQLVEPGEAVEIFELSGGLSSVVLRWRATGRCGVVKQARPRLRVAEVWLSDVRRALNEHDAIALLGQRLPAGSVPELTFSDDEAMAFGMACAPERAPLWRPLLLEERLDRERARQAGRLLRAIHDATRDDPLAAARFAAQPLLDQNRLDPWYRAAATKHHDLSDVMEYAIERLLQVRRVLVHGDFVPKNMFLVDDGILLLDYEVVHFGNPGYDTATFVNHMLLKAFRFPDSRAGFIGMARGFWDAYREGLPEVELELMEQEALLQLGALMLCRVDGKSKVEYLVDHPGADEARETARWLLRARPASMGEVLRRVSGRLPAEVRA